MRPLDERAGILRRPAAGVIGAAVVLGLAGCGIFQSAPSLESTKAAALELRSEMADTLPASYLSTATEDYTLIHCNREDIVQFDGVLSVSVPEDFDRTAWLDDAAAMYADRDGWRVEKKVAADGSSDATSAVAFFSDTGYYMRLGEFATTPEGGPVIILSASGPCSAQ